MKRRSFLKKTGLAAAGAAAAPVILPSGRLFAASGRRMAEHVVMVAFAGGVRNGAVTIKKRGNRGRITNAGFKTRWILKKSESKASMSPNNTTSPASCSWR